MIDYTNITITAPHIGRSYVLPIMVAERSIGSWSACIASLPQVAVWGTSQAEVLERLAAIVHASVDALTAYGVLAPIAAQPETLPVIDISAE